MNEKIKNFDDFNESEWNKIILNLTGHSHSFSWNFIKYYMSSYSDLKNLSFIYYFENKPIAAAAIGLRTKARKKVFSLGNHDLYCPSPLICHTKNSLERKKYYNKVIDIIKNIAKKFKVKKYLVHSHPIINSFDVNRNSYTPKLDSINQLEHLPFSKKFDLHESTVIDLSISNEKLWENLSYDRKRNIKRTIKKKPSILICSSKSPNDKINHYFEVFQKEHYIAAGFKTRTDKSWEEMKENLKKGEADLFILKNNTDLISFLFCRNYNQTSSSWSQVNLRKYEKEFSPRHLLEWEAIKYYKKNKNLFYDVGPRYLDYCNKKYDNKLISISDFKEKFGGQSYPCIKYELEF